MNKITRILSTKLLAAFILMSQLPIGTSAQYYADGKIYREANSTTTAVCLKSPLSVSDPSNIDALREASRIAAARYGYRGQQSAEFSHQIVAGVLNFGSRSATHLEVSAITVHRSHHQTIYELVCTNTIFLPQKASLAEAAHEAGHVAIVTNFVNNAKVHEVFNSTAKINFTEAAKTLDHFLNAAHDLYHKNSYLVNGKFREGDLNNKKSTDRELTVANQAGAKMVKQYLSRGAGSASARQTGGH